MFNFTPGIFSEFLEVEQIAERKGKFQILFFGRRDEEDFLVKGFDLAAEAVAPLDNIKLVFVGAPQGELEEVKNRFLKCGIHATDLTVRSFLKDRQSLKRSFCEEDLVVMPSRTEGFGLTALEALSAGLPILVSRNSGFGEALSEVLFGQYFGNIGFISRACFSRASETLKMQAFFVFVGLPQFVGHAFLTEIVETGDKNRDDLRCMQMIS